MNEGEQSIEELAPPEQEVEAPVEENAEEVEPEEVSETESETPPDDDAEEVEFNGETYKVPKALKDAIMMHGDYTKKTQEVADIRRNLETAQQQFQQNVEFQQAHLKEIVNLSSLEQQLSQYQGVDWPTLIENDPVEAMKLDRQYRTLQDAYQQTAGRIQQAQQAYALNQQQEFAKRVEQGFQALASEFKDWSPEVGKEVKDYLKSYERLGINDQIIEGINSGLYGTAPIVWARKAQLYDQLMKKTAQKTTTPPPKPVTKIGTKATVAKDPSQMTDKEFAQWRQKQIKARNSR